MLFSFFHPALHSFTHALRSIVPLWPWMTLRAAPKPSLFLTQAKITNCHTRRTKKNENYRYKSKNCLDTTILGWKKGRNRDNPPSAVLLSRSHDHMAKCQTAVMKTDWSQQHPHTWQTGRSDPCNLFRHGLSLTAESRRHYHQFICLGVWITTLLLILTAFQITSFYITCFKKMLQTRLHILC